MLILGAINRTTAILGDDDHGRNANTTKLDLAGHEGDDHEAHGSPEHEWITLTGTVSSILPRGMVVAESDGQHIEVALRTWLFAQEQGFVANVGDQVTLEGFYENGEFETACLTNLTNVQIVHLRDETGYPLWASGDH